MSGMDLFREFITTNFCTLLVISIITFLLPQLKLYYIMEAREGKHFVTIFH